MTISYNWLKEYIDIPESAEAIGEVLTSTGLEVETIESFNTVRGGLQGLIIGEVLTCTKHPNADKLSLTTVDVGGEAPLSIVCGAPNVAAGQKVVVAVPSTTIYPSNGEPFTIKRAKIRGEQSEGMICAEDEIGLGDNHDGIIVLNTTVANGTPAATFYNVQSDYILEIGLTPNRADAASHVGVARDIRAAKNRPLKLPSVEAFKTDHNALHIPVKVENIEACPRYSAVTISGVVVSESPSWLKNRLLSIGLTPINNIVDITNFVCHELGQPLHAFDADHITGGEVIVKTLSEGSKFTTLDGKERTLLSTDLMICNQQEGMCIAGVFGGIKSGITSVTTKVFLESACFSPDYIRRTSQHHQLKTDASFRFERGTDPNLTVYALKRAALLIKELAGGTISSEIIDVYPSLVDNRLITVKDSHVNRLIGKAITREDVFEILQRLDITVVEKTEDKYVVSVPPYRVDVVQEADVIEEILRIYGFNNIPLKDHVRADFLAEFPFLDPDKYRRTIGEMLINNGFFEIWTNSLTNQAYYTRHNVTIDGEPVEMLNKLSEEQGILRQTMLFTGLEVCAHNINRKQKDLKLFEFGKVYSKKENKYHEQEYLALYLTGNKTAETWREKPQALAYHDIAQYVSDIMTKSGLSDLQQQQLRQDNLLEYGVSLNHNNKLVAKLGKVKNALLKNFGIKQDLFYAELETALLFRAANPKFVVKDVPKFPEVRRDLSLVIDKKITFEDIEKLVQSAEKKLIKKIVVFDVYEGDNIPRDKKAYAMGFTLLDESKTLTDKEIDSTMDRLMKAFEQKLGAVIRK